MVALIHRYQDTLPKRRHKLYDRAVDTLLKSWDRKGKGETYGQFNHLDRDDDLRRVMSQLAYWIHTQYETQSTESGTLIEQEDLFTQLSRIIREEYLQVKPHQAREEAERFVAFIRDRTGLLNEYGRGRYAFVHKTFQEYLTAEAILNKAEYEDDSDLIYEAIQSHLHNPHWREVILLLVSQLQGKKAAKAIEVILRGNSLYEKWLHRDLLFAGRCLTEDPEKLSTAAPRIVSEILKELVDLEKGAEDHIGESIKEETFEILSWLRETAFEFEAFSYLKLLKGQMSRWRFLEFQWKLGEKDIALNHILNFCRDEESIVRLKAGLIIVKLANVSQEVTHGLLSLLEDEEACVRSSVATAIALGPLGISSQEIIQSLLSLLEDEESDVRSSAVLALGSLENTFQEVIQSLLSLIKDKEARIRSIAVLVLGNLGISSQEFIQSLLSLLEDEEAHVRSNTAQALGNLKNAPQEVIQSLLSLLEDEELRVRSNAALTLVRLKITSQEVTQNLLNLLEDEQSYVSFNVASAIESLNKSDPKFQSTLVQWIEQHSDLHTLGSATDALWQICA